MKHENEELQHPTGSQPSANEESFEEQASVHTGAEESSPAEGSLEQELEQTKQLAEKWQRQAEQHRELYLRALADLENYRRRARKEKEEVAKYAVVPFLEKLLPVLDNFERALDAADQSEDARMLQEGIEMVYRQFLNVLSETGLTMIETEGKPFNPHEHNAVMQVETDHMAPGMVVEELQAGYRYLDRVIRPSMVKVSQ
ncbi:nucleotide exchange factor GrpE [Laceyella putida]|uniref:Protein GrpE n=2 Tax=Laceyella putida TaxID=110101 RepID=A0ABW2RI53_9BACL